MIVTSGSLGDVFGRRRVFQLGLALFVVSCVFIGLSSSGGAVIAGRFIQGAAGATILACGLSLLTVANSGAEQLRAVSLWGAAAAVGAAAGPLVGGLLVDLTGWQGLFWIDAVVGLVCMVITRRSVQESRDENRSRSIDYTGSVLIALTLGPLILALSKGSAWGWASAATIGCLVVAVLAAVAFVMVEKRVAVPLLDLALLRNRVLVGSTVAILIGAGTINALMYVLSLWFQDPSSLGFTPLQAGLATLPATVGPGRRGAPRARSSRPGWGPARSWGSGSRSPRPGSPSSASPTRTGCTEPSSSRSSRSPWAWGCPTGRRRRPRPSCVPVEQVGSASGVSNMARYVGAAVATALAATVYSSFTASGTADGLPTGEALTNGLQATAWLMAVFSLAGVAMAVVMGRHARSSTGTLEDAAAAASAHMHTLPTSATPTSAATRLTPDRKTPMHPNPRPLSHSPPPTRRTRRDRHPAPGPDRVQR